MSRIAFVFLAFIIAVHADGSNNSSPTTIPPTTVPPKTTSPTTTSPTTTSPTTTSPTTTSPTTTTPPTTTPPTTTSPPTTPPTTTPPVNTTVKSTTAHATITADVTSQTTVAPPTSSTTAKPADTRVKLWYKDQSKICILLQINLNMTFAYKDEHNKSQTLTMSLPRNASVLSGSCGDSVQSMVVMFGPNADLLTFTFVKTSDYTDIQVISLNFTMDKTFPGINTTVKRFAEFNGTLFKGSSGHPYLCKSDINTTLSGVGILSVVLTTSNFEYAAFRTSNTTEFDSTYVNCPKDSATSNIVPIAVGAALAALVVIVLIAYLISRNRNKRGYESV